MYKFDEKAHVHTLNGKRLYGVTSVLKYWGDPNPLLNWGVKTAVNFIESNCSKWEDGEEGRGAYVFDTDLEEARTAHLKKRDKAGDLGTKVHKELEEMMLDWIDDPTLCRATEYSPDVVEYVKQWMQSESITPLQAEANLYSETHWYGGIVDGLLEKEGKKYILDFKTSGTVQTKYFYQMGAYSLAYKEMGGDDIAGVIVVHIPRGRSFDPKKNVYWRTDVEAMEQAWLNILNTFKLDQKLQKVVSPWKK